MALFRTFQVQRPLPPILTRHSLPLRFTPPHFVLRVSLLLAAAGDRKPKRKTEPSKSIWQTTPWRARDIPRGIHRMAFTAWLSLVVCSAASRVFDETEPVDLLQRTLQLDGGSEGAAAQAERLRKVLPMAWIHVPPHGVLEMTGGDGLSAALGQVVLWIKGV